MPADDEPLPELQAEAQVTSLAAAMAQLDRTFDQLQLCQQSDWKAPADHPDLVPLNEAVLAKEILRESARLLPDTSPVELASGLTAAEQLTAALEQALRTSDLATASAKLGELKTSCKTCHREFRDKAD